jgi:hypothetical protein
MNEPRIDPASAAVTSEVDSGSAFRDPIAARVLMNMKPPAASRVTCRTMS